MFSNYNNLAAAALSALTMLPCESLKMRQLL